MAFANELKLAISEKAEAFAQEIAQQATSGALTAVKTALVGAPGVQKQKKKGQAKKPAPMATGIPSATITASAPIDHSPKTAAEEAKDLNGAAPQKKPRGRAKTQPSVCTVSGCAKETLAKGLCSAHYRAARYALKHAPKDAAPAAP